MWINHKRFGGINMKNRNGFVSNSSSSSFICEVCGEAEAGMDASLEDFDMCECENHHIFHNSEMVEGYEPKEKDDEDDDGENYVDEAGCPICTMKVIRDADILRFVYQNYKTERKTLEDLMRKTKFDIS